MDLPSLKNSFIILYHWERQEICVNVHGYRILCHRLAASDCRIVSQSRPDVGRFLCVFGGNDEIADVSLLLRTRGDSRRA